MDITAIVSALVALIGAAITGFVIPYLKERVSREKYENISNWVRVAVSAAEQLFGSGRGKEKKAYVIEFLSKKGLYIDEEKIDCLIEELTAEE